MKKPLYIAVDFDGVVVKHWYPEVGPDVPGAEAWLKAFAAVGARLILWTMRSDGQPDGDVLWAAMEWFKSRGIPLFGVNENPEQHTWTSSPKAWAHIYIDDSAIGCPLLFGPVLGERPYVDWSRVGPLVMQQIIEWMREDETIQTD
jgi:hypothetical protein